MKPKYFLLILCIVFVCAIKAYPEEKTVRLAGCEYPPYYGTSLQNNGFITEIITEAFKRKGYKVHVDFLPWKRALKLAKMGKYDGIYTIWYRKEREQWFAYSDPFPPNEIGFYKRREDTIPFATLEDLKPYIIGIVRGYTNPPKLEKAEYLIKEEVPTDVMNLTKLYHGRIDLALIDKTLAQYLIKTRFPEYADRIEWMGPPLELLYQHIGFSRKKEHYQKIVSDFNKGLQEISPATSIFLITAYANDKRVADALKCGAIDVLQKPFDVDMLLGILESSRLNG